MHILVHLYILCMCVHVFCVHVCCVCVLVVSNMFTFVVHYYG